MDGAKLTTPGGSYGSWVQLYPAIIEDGYLEAYRIVEHHGDLNPFVLSLAIGTLENHMILYEEVATSHFVYLQWCFHVDRGRCLLGRIFKVTAASVKIELLVRSVV